MTINSKMTNKTLKQIEKITGERLTLGRLIWAIRMGENETQVKFAKKLHISKQQLCDIEHNRKSVSPGLAGEYAKRLGYSEAQFIQLSLQGILDRDGINMSVELKKNDGQLGHVAFA